MVGKFINQFLIGQSPVINGDGNFSRDFTYVDNILQMNYLAMTTEKVNSINQIYNAAVGDRISIREMAESIKMSLIKYGNKLRLIKKKIVLMKLISQKLKFNSKQTIV